MLIKFLLSAFDISAKLYPLQEQESPSLQRGAHSVTCNYGIYCGVKRCLGCTCHPSAPHTAPQRQPLLLANAKGPRLRASAQGRSQHTYPAGSTGPECRPGVSVGPAHPPRPRLQIPPTLKEGLLDVKVKNGFFNEKVERPEPRWVRSPADCWFQAGSYPFL